MPRVNGCLGGLVGAYQVCLVFSGCYMGSCQNYGPFLGTLNNRCRIIIGTQNGTIILTTTHMGLTMVLHGVSQGVIMVLQACPCGFISSYPKRRGLESLPILLLGGSL